MPPARRTSEDPRDRVLCDVEDFLYALDLPGYFPRIVRESAFVTALQASFAALQASERKEIEQAPELERAA